MKVPDTQQITIAYEGFLPGSKLNLTMNAGEMHPVNSVGQSLPCVVNSAMSIKEKDRERLTFILTRSRMLCLQLAILSRVFSFNKFCSVVFCDHGLPHGFVKIIKNNNFSAYYLFCNSR